MRSLDPIERIETFILSIPRNTPYLGPPGPGETINERGYLIRRGNRSIYPVTDMSVLVKATTRGGVVGWGESYAICAPEAIVAIIDDLLAPCVIGRDPFDVEVISEDLYDMMRVRGFTGGFYVDALAGIDIALWDLCGKLTGLPLCKLLGGRRRDTIPAYVSGLPCATLSERADLAAQFVTKGFGAIKFAGVVSHEGVAREAMTLREAIGDATELMVDLHWKFTADEAVALLDRLTPARLYFAEAPCQTEDIAGLAAVAARSRIPIAGGEEWHTVFEARPRLEARCVSIIQPEMGHTGVTQFMRIGRMAEAFHCRVIPHASIGIGIFQAASLHAAAALLNVPYHEYQHSIFDKNLPLLSGDMACDEGHFRVPTGPGLGVEPLEAAFQHLRKAA